MRKAIGIARLTYVILAVIVLGLALSCGGGSHKSVGTLPAVSSGSGNDSTASFGAGDRRACIPEDEVYKLSPIMQEMYGDPGWKGSVTPVPASTPVPAPPALNIEDAAARCEGTARLERDGEPVVPVRGVSHLYIPPDEPGYYPMPGEYDSEDWNGTPPPPWGSDGDDEDIYEDRIQRVEDFTEQGRSFVKEGSTRPNQFNRGTTEVGTLTAVYQTYDIPTGGDPEWGEWSYPSEDTYDVVTEPAYFVDGYVYDKMQMSTSVRRYSQMVDFAWYDILIAPVDDMGDDYMSTQPPNETYASYQPYFFDDETLLFGEAWMVELASSENDYIQELIDLQVADDMPVAVFPVFGIIHQRWADDVWNMGVDPPWEGRLGWPLSDPFIDRGGRLLTGPLGPYYRYGQYFEKGFMWHVDYIDPEMPDEVYVYMYDEDSTLDPGGEYTQDPTVVKYGTGGPLGCNVVVNPLIANVGDPIFFKAFPYGGPVDNANGFADDWYLWNFRDGTVSSTHNIMYPIHEYYTEARYVARLMFSLDYDGDGNPDGDTPGYKVFADSPEIEIGHLGEAGEPGSGGGALVVEAPGGTANANAIKADLDTLGVGYDEATSAEITSVEDMEGYLIVIWCPSSSTYQFNTTQLSLIQQYIDGGGNWLTPYTAAYSIYYTSSSFFINYLGTSSAFGYSMSSSYPIVTSGYVLGTGPGGMIASLTWIGGSYTTASYGNLQPNSWALCQEPGFSSYRTGVVHDRNTGADGYMACWFGFQWDMITGTSPATPGRSGALENLLNYIDPEIFVGGGGPVGDDTIVPYDGPVDIADVFAWLYAEDGSAIDGGDGDAPEDQVEIWVLDEDDPQSVWFECLARSAGEPEDLIYEWSFEPGDPFSVWTRYTAHWYDGGIDPDGGGPLEEGDEFDVWARVYDSSAASSYDTAPPDSRDIDSVKIKVHGPPPIDIRDDGTVIEAGYSRDPSGNVTVPLDFWIEGGVPPYDSVWIDYDYDFVTFNQLHEVTPTPGEGHTDYDLVFPGTAGQEYYIAIRAYDTEAPNSYDTYVWLDAVNVTATVLVIRDGAYSTAHSQLINSLNSFTSDYMVRTSTSGLTSSEMLGYKVVIWQTGYSGNTNISATEKSVLKDFWDDGGKAIMMVPYEYYSYIGGSYDQSWLLQYWGVSFSYPYTYLYRASTSYYYYHSSSYTWSPFNNGPGGTVNYINFYTGYPYYYHCYLYNSYNSNNVTRLIRRGYYSQYNRGWYRDISGGGRNVVWGQMWSSYMYVNGTAGVNGVLRNLIELANPDAL